MDVLRCPVTRESLTLLSASEIAATNEDFDEGRRLHRDSSAARAPLTNALGTRNRDYVYRVEDDIAWLLPNLALVRPGNVASGLFAPEKEIVKSFYDDFGWVKKSGDLFNDTAEFTDPRPIAQDYLRYCNARIGRLLGSGRLLLDVACGAIPHREYLAFSEGYEIRVCVDFSIRALSEARAKLGNRGLYLLGDITCLPLVDGSVDSVISLHTIYHVPQPEQTTAVDELVRVTRPGGRVIIVYAWGRSLAMDAVFKLRGWLGFLRRLGRPSPVAAAAGAKNSPPLYFHPQNHDWFARDVAARHSARLKVWSAVSKAFQTRFLSDGLMGRLSIAAVEFLENTLPAFAGRVGQYPMFVIDKP
jgi:SAM-dependent methyltransferase/uncharacterized protein YbaR (Trm112 family)